MVEPGEILVVEDESGLRATLAANLESQGYGVIACAGGREAIGRIHLRAPDVVMADLRLPDVSGLEILESFKEINPEGAFIIITGHATVETAVQALNLGAFAYISKPFNMDEVNTVVRSGLRQRRLLLENQRLVENLQHSNKDMEEANMQLQGATRELAKSKQALEGANAEISDWNRQLQRRVDERTAELMARNAELEAATRELVESQARLVRSEKLAAIGTLASGVSHELRNPLGIMNNTLFYLKMRLEGQEPKVGRHLDILERAVVTCTNVVSEMLDFVRPGTPSFDELNVNLVVDEAMARCLVPDAVRVVLHLGMNLPVIQADPEQMRRVLVNLISNGIEAMPEGGTLTLRTGAYGDFVTIGVDDKGVGIPKENLPKMFEPLFTTKRRGTGLGLTISHRIVEEHGGSIEVKSQAGKGSCFSVALPIRQRGGRA